MSKIDLQMTAFDPLQDGISQVQLVDSMGSDERIIAATRMSFLVEENTSRGIDKDKKLIKYLLENKHTSPFEQVFFTFKVRLPIVVMNQWQRHRTGKYLHINEVSRRYTTDNIEFYVPSSFRKQSDSNKQGSLEDSVIESNAFLKLEMQDYFEDGLFLYKEAINKGVAKEQARLFLPAYSLYTTVLVSVDLHNLMHFLELRMDNHAQWEIRQYANCIHKIVKQLCPLTLEVWDEIRRGKEQTG